MQLATSMRIPKTFTTTTGGLLKSSLPALPSAIAISCLAYLLTLLLINGKIKEIGIRKVLGSSIMNIILLLSKNFLMLIGLAFLISTPIAWLLMTRWLEAFAFRIAIQWWMFALAGGIA